MKIIIEDRMDGEEDEIIIRCKSLDESILQMIYGIKMKQQKVVGVINGKSVLIEPKEIFYFEAVDNRVYIYCKQMVYESKQKLYEIEESFEHTDFIRASKSTIINLAKVKSLSPAFNGRLEALLQNGERTIISRQYVPILKQKLML
ncbi:MAG TPA: LytTR family DNA-binding domain-containing protein [Lachnospiraceae bacterium]|nr:LytTR family DNA-binding domain-containing protein [Lachnospiraceae bacterium]HEX3075488.1 LytTR family DNA-binding domain-containing protein [Lachnospiraceae bacterium]